MQERIPREVPAKVWRKAVIPPAALGIVMTIFGWSAFVAVTVFHFDFLSRDHTVADDSAGQLRQHLYLALAVCFTLVGGVGGALVAKTQLYTVRYGSRVVGMITGLASVEFKGAKKIVVEYDVNGRTYKYQASDGTAATMAGLGLGDEVTVFAHPTRPQRAVVMWERPTWRSP